MAQESQKFKNFAFISYSHEDMKQAEMLDNFLLEFRLPTQVKEKHPNLRDTFHEIFPDNTGLGATTDLGYEIKRQLDQSEYLIVICSPNAVKSDWVNEEIEYFKCKRGLECIYPFVVDGIVNAKSPNESKECMPKALRPYKGRAANISTYSFEHAIIEILAAILNVEVDEIWQRHVRLEEKRKLKLKEQNDRLLIAQSRFSSETVLKLAQSDDNHLARRLCLETIPTPCHPDYPYTPKAESALRAANQNEVYIFKGHSNFKEIFTVQFSPDGKSVISASKDNTVRIWDVATGKCKMVITGESDYHTSASFSPDGKNIAIASRDNFIHIVDSATGKEVRRLDGQSFIVESVTYSPNGLRLASVSRDDILQVWDIEKGTSIFALKGAYGFFGPKYNSNRLNSSIFSPNGDKILIPYNKSILIWDIENNSSQEIGKCDGTIKMVLFSPNGEYLLAVSDNNTIFIWIVSNKELLNSYRNEEQIIKNVHFSSDNSSIYVDSETGFFKWNINSGNKTEYGTNLFPVQSLYFQKNRITIAGSKSNNLYVREIPIKVSYKTIMGHTGHIVSIQYNQDGNKIISSASDGIRVWDSFTCECIQQFDGFAFKTELDSFEAKAYTIGGEISQQAKSFQIWDIQSGQCLRTFSGYDFILDRPIAMSKNGKRIATTCGNIIYIWNVYSVKKIKCARRLVYEYGGADCACFSPDGNMLAVAACTNKNLCIWDINKEELKVEMQGHTLNILSINYSSDGKKIVTSSYDGSIRIWNAETGVCEQVLNYNTENVEFNHDGTQILFVSGGKPSIWDVETGIKIQDIEVNNVEMATFSPDDKTVALATTDNSILLYPVVPFKELAENG